MINTGTTIVTFLMVFLIQNTQNRDTEAMQLKLDELIRATQGAHNALLDLEELEEKELEAFRRQLRRLAMRTARRGTQSGTPEVDTHDVDTHDVDVRTAVRLSRLPGKPPSMIAKRCRPPGSCGFELVVDALLQQRPRQRRVDADAAEFRVGLVRADDAVAVHFAAGDVLDLDRAPRRTPRRDRRRGIDHAQHSRRLDR